VGLQGPQLLQLPNCEFMAASGCVMSYQTTTSLVSLINLVQCMSIAFANGLPAMVLCIIPLSREAVLHVLHLQHTSAAYAVHVLHCTMHILITCVFVSVAGMLCRCRNWPGNGHSVLRTRDPLQCLAIFATHTHARLPAPNLSHT
jgi:hypothetical protein